MFISTLDLLKVGIGPSSSHTMGPLSAANDFRTRIAGAPTDDGSAPRHLRCTLKGSLAFTGKGHATDSAVLLGMHGYNAEQLAHEDVSKLVDALQQRNEITVDGQTILFHAETDIIFDRGAPLPQHPNGLIFELFDGDDVLLSETYFSIGGGFINTLAEINELAAPIKTESMRACKFPFDSAQSMLEMSERHALSIAEMKRANEHIHLSEAQLDAGLDTIWQAMSSCIENGLSAQGILPGGLDVPRRAKTLFDDLSDNPDNATINDWLCAYAMAVNEENAAGHMVVTAPTNGAAGVVPAVLYYYMQNEAGTVQDAHDYLLVASAIGGLIKHRSSISGAEVGCQGEVGSASAMAAAGLCAVKGGNTEQIENAAEIALEHHLGMTCDPVAGLVQVPCIERNGFGAIKAYTAASLALRGTGQHFMPLDSCIEAMKKTGQEMSHKYKETSLGGLAVSITEC